jgi:hypothetical protein
MVDAIVGLLKPSGIDCDRAVGITSPRIATNKQERLALAKSGAGVVDMESYSILESAAAVGVSVAVLRVVADSLDRALPDLNRALDATGGLDGRKALRVALGSPVRTAKLLATLTAIPAAVSRIDPISALYAGTVWATWFGPFFATAVIAVLFLCVKSALTRSVDRYYAVGCVALIASFALIMGLAPTGAWDSVAGFLLR